MNKINFYYKNIFHNFSFGFYSIIFNKSSTAKSQLFASSNSLNSMIIYLFDTKNYSFNEVFEFIIKILKF